MMQSAPLVIALCKTVQFPMQHSASESRLPPPLTDRAGLHAGQTQAMLALALVHEQLQRRRSLRRYRAQTAMTVESASLLVGAANPLFTDVAKLSTVGSSSTQPAPEEASLSNEQRNHPMEALFTDNALYDMLPSFTDKKPHQTDISTSLDALPLPRSPCLPPVDSSRPSDEEPHHTDISTPLDSLSLPRSPCLPPVDPSCPTDEEPHYTDISTPLDCLPFPRRFCLPAVDLSCFTSTEAQVTRSGQTDQDDPQPSTWPPTHPDSAETFGGFLPHAMPNTQSGSDRSDSRDSFVSNSTHAPSSPRSTLPAMHRPIQKLPLLGNSTPPSDASLSGSSVLDTCSQALHKSPPLSPMRSPLTAQTQALTIQKRANSNQLQVIHSLSMLASVICI